MRAKQSSIASGKDSRTGPHTFTTISSRSERRAVTQDSLQPLGDLQVYVREGLAQVPSVANGEGLLHDARNLIGAMRLYCDLLAQPGVLPREHRLCAEELSGLTLRSGKMIEEWLRKHTFAPAEVPVQAAHCGSRSLEWLLANSRGLLDLLAGEPIEWELDGAVEAAEIVSPDSLERVLVNLVSNSARAQLFGRCPGRIRILTSLIYAEAGQSGPPELMLIVDDRGCGMTPEQLAALFKPRLNRDCHGIGFQVVRELIAEVGGALDVTSEVGYGSRVCIHWPLASERAGHKPVRGENGSQSQVAPDVSRSSSRRNGRGCLQDPSVGLNLDVSGGQRC